MKYLHYKTHTKIRTLYFTTSTHRDSMASIMWEPKRGNWFYCFKLRRMFTYKHRNERRGQFHKMFSFWVHFCLQWLYQKVEKWQGVTYIPYYLNTGHICDSNRHCTQILNHNINWKKISFIQSPPIDEWVTGAVWQELNFPIIRARTTLVEDCLFYRGPVIILV